MLGADDAAGFDWGVAVGFLGLAVGLVTVLISHAHRVSQWRYEERYKACAAYIGALRAVAAWAFFRDEDPEAGEVLPLIKEVVARSLVLELVMSDEAVRHIEPLEAAINRLRHAAERGASRGELMEMEASEIDRVVYAFIAAARRDLAPQWIPRRFRRPLAPGST